MGFTQVERDGIKDDAISSGKIPDNAVGTSEIEDGAVTLAKLANGSSDGLVLTSNSGSAPTFNTPTVEGTNVKSDGISGTTKFLRADGDNTCSWQVPAGGSVVTTSADGLAPQLPNPHGGKFLKADASWEVPPYPNTVDISNNGLAPILPSTDGVNTPGGKFLKADGTWQIPDYIANTDTTYNIFTESTNGLAPGTASGGGDQNKFLKGDATWAVPTVPDVTTTASGVVAALPSSDASTKFLRGDNTWVVPPDTTYNLVSAASQGIAPQGLNPHGDKYLRADGTWQTTPATDISGKADLSGATFTGHVILNDSKRLKLGTDEDCSFYHNDNHAWLVNDKGNLNIRSTEADTDVTIRGARDVILQVNEGEKGLKVLADGAVELYHDNVKKLESTSTGIDITGNIVVSGSVDGIADLNTTVTANTAKVTNATHTGDVTGDTALTIADDKIEEKHINAGGTAGAGKVLVYDSSATGNWKWDDQSGGGGGSTTLSGLTDVTISSASSGQVLKYNGSAWVNDTDATGGGGGGGSGLDPVIMGMIF
jgi:hypothetical protein